MGTAVGITAYADHRALDAAYAAIESFEAELSEWRPDSTTFRLVAHGHASFRPDSLALFDIAEDLRVATNGAFNISWRGGAVRRQGDTVHATGKVDLGGILKGFLADRAADALRDAGVANFVIDAAGDIVAHGDAGDGTPGWPVTVVTQAASWNVRLRDEALSTSAEDEQPDHIVDGRTGEAVHCIRSVAVTAPTGARADASATAFYATCGKTPLPGVTSIRWVGQHGWKHQR